MRILVFLFSLSAFSLFAECSCCGCADGSACDINGIVDAITNSAQNACSSNCVHMSPQDCELMKGTMSRTLDDLDGYSSEVREFLINLDSVLSESQSQLNSILVDLDSLEQILSSNSATNDNAVSSAVSSLSNVLSSIDIFSNRWSSVDNGGSGFLFVSNLSFHVSLTLPPFVGVNRPIAFCASLASSVKAALSSLQTYQTLDISIIQSLKGNVISLRDSFQNFSNSDEYSSALQNVNFVMAKTDDLRISVLSLDCSPCGRGSGSSGGGDGGIITNVVDLTPLVSAINDLRLRLDYHMDRLYNLIKRLFQDYQFAADNIPDYDLSTYPSSKNWFVRIEQLLAALSDPGKKGIDTVGDNGPTTPPEPIEDSSEISDLESNSTSAETDAQTQAASLDNILEGGWSKVSRSLTNFANSLRGIGRANTNIDGMSLDLDFSIPGSDGKYTDVFKIPYGTSTRLTAVRAAFTVFWALLCVFLYIYAFKLFFSLLLAYIAWFLKLASATFGS